MSWKSTNTGGYTLIEVVTVTTILSIVGLVSSVVIIESINVHAQTSPAMLAGYQTHLASERLKRDIRAMSDTASITVLSPTALSFVDNSGAPIDYLLSGGDLLCNGDLVAQGLTGFGFTYRTQDGAPVTTPSELHLVKVDLTAQVASQSFRAQLVVFPRCITP